MFSKQLSYIISIILSYCYHILSYKFINIFQAIQVPFPLWVKQLLGLAPATELGLCDSIFCGDSWTDLSNGYGEGMTDISWHGDLNFLETEHTMRFSGRTSISFEQPICGILWHLGRITLLILAIYNKIIVIQLFMTGLTASRSAGGIACQPFLSLRKELAAEAPGLPRSSRQGPRVVEFSWFHTPLHRFFGKTVPGAANFADARWCRWLFLTCSCEACLASTACLASQHGH